MGEEIITIKGEAHYNRPHIFVNGNSTRCDGCRYYRPDITLVTGERVEQWTGKCISRAHLTERGQVAPEYAFRNSRCRWWFPIGHQPGEHEGLFDGKEEA